MKNFDKIERYLNGKMLGEEKNIFESEINRNPDLAAEVKLQKIEEEAIGLSLEDDLLAAVRQIAKEEETSINPVIKKKKSLLRIRWIQMAAAASVLLLAGYFTFQSVNSKFDYKEYAMEHLDKHRPNLSGTMSSGNLDKEAQQERIYDNAISTGNHSEMKAAISFFKNKNDLKSIYKLGHAQLLNKEFEASIQSFGHYIANASPTDKYYQATEFYLALARLGSGDAMGARALLMDVRTKGGHPYREVAFDVLSGIPN